MRRGTQTGQGRAAHGAVIACIALAAGCSGVEDSLAGQSVTGIPFEELFAPVSGFPLDQGDSVHVLSPAGLAVGPEGEIAVVDGSTGQVLLYGRDGSLEARYPQGRGARFEEPLDIAVGRDGSWYVAGAPSGSVTSTRSDPRGAITRLTHDLRIDTVLPIPGAYFTLWVEPIGDRIAAGVVRPRGPGDEVRLVNEDGTPSASLHPQSEEVQTVPYWNAWYRTFGTPSAEGLTVANSLYPVAVYERTGEPVRQFGQAGPGLRMPSRPDSFQFAGPGGRHDYEAWVRSFTVIDGVTVLEDSLHLVQLKDLDGEVTAYARPEFRADLFLPGQELPAFRITGLPGRIVHSDSLLYLLRRQDEAGGSWMVEWYQRRRSQGG